MSEKSSLLIVDDEIDNLDALERIFRKKYNILKATSGSEALDILLKYPKLEVIITDQRMPSMTGVELLEKVQTTHPKMVRILLTGFTEIDSIIAAVNKGHIFRYITKPWDTVDLMNSVDQAMEHYSRGHQLDLRNKELEQALENLKTLDKAKSKFMILINHELKTPLTVLSSFLDLLTETSLNTEQKMYIEHIKKSTSRFKEIFEDTLVLVNYTNGLLKPTFKEVNLQEIFQRIILELSSEASKKGLIFEINSTTPESRKINLDPDLISKALLHLLVNTVRFSDSQSKVIISINFNSSTSDFFIENEGPPISNSVLEKIDTPFNLPSEIMNHTKGLGLGLSVADAILRLHNSHLKLENFIRENKKSVIRASFSLSH